MYILVSILVVIASIFLVFFVVIQNSKGGGLAAGFASSNQVMGVRKTTDFLEKATWVLAGAIVFGCIIASVSLRNNKGEAESTLRQEIQNMAPAEDPNATAPFGTAAPAEETPVE
jgi:preprotein translocase subunit SecG